MGYQIGKQRQDLSNEKFEIYSKARLHLCNCKFFSMLKLTRFDIRTTIPASSYSLSPSLWQKFLRCYWSSTSSRTDVYCIPLTVWSLLSVHGLWQRSLQLHSNVNYQGPGISHGAGVSTRLKPVISIGSDQFILIHTSSLCSTALGYQMSPPT